MARRRFYAPPHDIAGSNATLSPEETNHLIRVLRMTPGDEAFVFDGCGHEYRCTLRTVLENRAQLNLLDELNNVVESPLHLTLAQALAKGEKFDFIVQKATELGVTSIAPIATRYSDPKVEDQHTARRVERWRRISLEALKQCGRRTLVEIAAPSSLTEFLAAMNSPAPASEPQRTFLVFSERGGATAIEALAGLSKPDASFAPRSIVALIGPEGGWSEGEFNLLNQCGKAVTLGRRVLRTETAAVVAITLIQYALGDLSA